MVISIPTVFESPPLRSNHRHHWARKAKLTRMIRQAMFPMVRGLHLPQITTPVTVTLIWTVCDRRRRDVGASAPTLKAAIDGIVDAGLLLDDSSRWVREERCRIEIGDRPGVRIEIEEAT